MVVWWLFLVVQNLVEQVDDVGQLILGLQGLDVLNAASTCPAFDLGIANQQGVVGISGH